MAENIEIQDTLVGCPDRVIAPATHKRLLGYADQLKAMNFRPTPEESGPRKGATTDWPRSIGEDPAPWLDRYRANRIGLPPKRVCGQGFVVAHAAKAQDGARQCPRRRFRRA